MGKYYYNRNLLPEIPEDSRFPYKLLMTEQHRDIGKTFYCYACANKRSDYIKQTLDDGYIGELYFYCSTEEIHYKVYYLRGTDGNEIEVGTDLSSAQWVEYTEEGDLITPFLEFVVEDGSNGELEENMPDQPIFTILWSNYDIVDMTKVLYQNMPIQNLDSVHIHVDTYFEGTEPIPEDWSDYRKIKNPLLLVLVMQSEKKLVKQD